MKYYYNNADGQAVGPLDLAEISALAASGTIAPNPAVRAENTETWVPLDTIAPQGPTFAKRLKSVDSAILSSLVAKMLDLARKALPPRLVGLALDKSRSFGHYAVLAAFVLTFVYMLFAAIKENQFAIVPTGIAYLALLAIAQFAAQSFLGAGEKLIRNANSRIATSAFLDCFGMLSLAAAILLFLGGIVAAIQMGSIVPLLPATLLSILLVFIAAQTLHPQLVNTDIGDASPGEEAIGLLSLFLKIGLKLVPLGFFLLAVLGVAAIVLAFGGAGRAIASLAYFAPWITYNTPVGFAGSTLVIFACLLPMLGYFFFLLFFLTFDLIRAILSIPGKLDALRRDKI